MALTEAQRILLAAEFSSALRRAVPGWTGGNSTDPGVTLLELISFVQAEASIGVAADNSDCGDGLQRVNYSSGMVLGVDDFQAEQDYFRHRAGRLNRLLLGAGIVSGLGVSVEHDDDGSRVRIAPGLALDPAGDEMAIVQPAALALPARGDKLLVLLRYAERPCRPMPAAGTGAGEDPEAPLQPTRIVESFMLALAPAPAADAVALARLRQVRGRWRIDRAFKAPAVRA